MLATLKKEEVYFTNINLSTTQTQLTAKWSLDEHQRLRCQWIVQVKDSKIQN